MQVLAHGGAGGVPTDPHERQAILDDAVAQALTAGTPEAAVVEVVTGLERSRGFNAGLGGTVQSDGVHRADAGLMSSDGAIGAVAGVTGVSTPIAVARFVKHETPHVLVGQPGAADIAAHLGVDGAAVGTDRTRRRFDATDMPDDPVEQLAEVSDRFGDGDSSHDHDTVGAVARSGSELAAATSTGGRFLAFRGRIGDVPQVGCGFFCSSAAAVSTTGAGEAIARVTLARSIERRIDAGASSREAVAAAVAAFDRETDAGAGAIAIDTAGGYATGYNTARMQTAYASDG